MTTFRTARVQTHCLCGRGRLLRGFACQACLRDMGVGRVIACQGGILSSFTLTQQPEHYQLMQRAKFVEVKS